LAFVDPFDLVFGVESPDFLDLDAARDAPTRRACVPLRLAVVIQSMVAA